jgi:hypothetical protein
MEHPPMEHPPRHARRSTRRLGKAALVLAVLAVLAGCVAALFGLVMLFSNTESPIEGPLLLPLMLVLLATPVWVAAILVRRILGGGGSRDDGFVP